MSYEQAMDLLSRDDRFKATVYAMNILLMSNGFCIQCEFQEFFVDWAKKEQTKSAGSPIRANEVSA